MEKVIKDTFILVGVLVLVLMLWYMFFSANLKIAGKNVHGGAVTMAETSFEIAIADYYEKYCFIPNSARHADFSKDYSIGESEGGQPTIDDCYSTSDGVKFVRVAP